MPRYFFIATYPGEREISCPDAVPLLNDTAAVEYARRVIDSLHVPGEPGPSIVVKTVAGEVVYRFPCNSES